MPFNIFKQAEFHTWLNGLSLPKDIETENLLARYGGTLIEEFYTEGMYFGQFATLEDAYNFAKDNYFDIVEKFKATL